MSSKNEQYDVVIVGAGPAGLFAALELSEAANLKILLLEKGRDLPERSHDNPSSLLCGWGGAGAYSDGKLNLSTTIGGQLANYIGSSNLEEIIRVVDSAYVRFGASNNVYGGDSEAILDFKRKAAMADLRLETSIIRHIGTEVCLSVLSNIRDLLLKKIDFRPDTFVKHILVEDCAVCGVSLENGENIKAGTVIVAPGREGSEWLKNEATRLGLQRENNPVDIGVRVEVSAPVMESLSKSLYESKFIYNSPSFDDPVRTFCMCPRGEVVIEENNGVVTVNGHSWSNRFTDNTNFAVLVSTRFTEPFDSPFMYGKYIASLANMLAGGVIVQRLGDLRAGRRSTPDRIAKGPVTPTLKTAVPGDLSFVLPYRYLQSILEMMDALDRVAPGVNSRGTLLYGVEVKFYSSRVDLDGNLESNIKNLFAIGDGAGITRGLVQASASGVIAAREIIRKNKEAKK